MFLATFWQLLHFETNESDFQMRSEEKHLCFSRKVSSTFQSFMLWTFSTRWFPVNLIALNCASDQLVINNYKFVGQLLSTLFTNFFDSDSVRVKIQNISGKMRFDCAFFFRTKLWPNFRSFNERSNIFKWCQRQGRSVMRSSLHT